MFVVSQSLNIFVAGIITETNTFCPLPTALEDFRIQRGKDPMPALYPDLDLSVTWGRQAATRGDRFVFSLMAWAQPAGVTARSAYEALRDEILSDLRGAMPVDVVLLNLHGAMIAQGYEDCEEDLIRRARAVVGPSVVIGVELDLHCHISPAKIAAADLVVIYKEYPHTDINERAAELFDLAIATKLGEVRPTLGLFDCRMVGLYPTSRQPLRGLTDAMRESEGRDGVLSISFAHGFQFADVPHVGAKVLVFADGDQALAERLAKEIGLKLYAVRDQLGFETLSRPMDEVLSKAIAAKKFPVIVADQSDNPGGGAPGDATFALRWLLDHRAESAAIGILYDPEVIRVARKAGRGAKLPVRLGGKLGPTSGQPVDIEVTVLSVIDDYVHSFPQRTGPPSLRRAGNVAALRCAGIDVVVGSERCQCLSPSIFDDLGVDVARKQVVVVKSAQHFFGAFSSIAAEVMYMAGPGAVPPDPKMIRYRNLDTTRLYPWVRDPLL